MFKNLLMEPYEESDEYLQKARKIELAEKLLSKERLTKAEKIEIYELLTGNHPPNIKGPGRPSEERRDQAIAFEFLFAKAKGEKQLHNIKKALVAKFELSEMQNTFYAALKKGMDLLYDRATADIPKYEATVITGNIELEETRKKLLSTSQKLIALIDDYRNKNTPKN